MLRTFNQDSLENFFDSIRSLGYHNNNPSTVDFSSAYKTLIVNSLMSINSPGNNCEEDYADGCLTSYCHLFNFKSECISSNEKPRIGDGRW